MRTRLAESVEEEGPGGGGARKGRGGLCSEAEEAGVEDARRLQGAACG